MSIKSKLQHKEWTGAFDELKTAVEKCSTPSEAGSEITMAFSALPKDTPETEIFVSNCVDLLIHKIAAHGLREAVTWKVYLRMLDPVKEFQSYDVEPYSIRMVKQLFEHSCCMDEGWLDHLFTEITNHFGNDHKMTNAARLWCREQMDLWGG